MTGGESSNKINLVGELSGDPIDNISESSINYRGCVVIVGYARIGQKSMSRKMREIAERGVNKIDE